jgi:RecA-family ATPase
VKLDLPHSFNAFARTLEKFQPDVVLVDSFKKFHSKNELASQDMQFIFTKLEEIKDKFGCSFVFIHHEPKGVIQKRKEDFEVRATDASGTIDFQQTSEHFFNVIVKAEPHTSMVYHTKNNLGDKQLPILVKIADQDESKTITRVEAY